MDFSWNGELLVSSAEDGSISLCNAQAGTLSNKVLSHKYGADLVRFTMSEDVVYASKNGWNGLVLYFGLILESIRQLNIETNTYLRYYKGHRDQYFWVIFLMLG